jgi:hypothetical protein
MQNTWFKALLLFLLLVFSSSGEKLRHRKVKQIGEVTSSRNEIHPGTQIRTTLHKTGPVGAWKNGLVIELET